LSDRSNVRPRVGDASVRAVSTFHNPKAGSEIAGPTSNLACIVYCIDQGTKLTGSRILNFGPCGARGYPELSPVGRDDPPRTLHWWQCLSGWQWVSVADFGRHHHVTVYRGPESNSAI